MHAYLCGTKQEREEAIAGKPVSRKLEASVPEIRPAVPLIPVDVPVIRRRGRPKVWASEAERKAAQRAASKPPVRPLGFAANVPERREA